MAKRDPAGMVRERADGAVWQKEDGPDGKWKQLEDGHGPSGNAGMETGTAGEHWPADNEQGTAQWSDTVVRHDLDGHTPEATIHPAHVDVDLEGDTDAKPVMSWTDSAGAARHAYSKSFHHRRAALLQPAIAQARPVIVAAHAALREELKGARAPAAALAMAHLVTGHDLEDLAAADVYHNRGGEADLEVARSAGRVKVERSHTADAAHPDKVFFGMRHRRGHVILAPLHDADLAAHHEAGEGHGSVADARALLSEHGLEPGHAAVVRAHALFHHAADQLSKLPGVDLGGSACTGIKQIVANVQSVSDYIAGQYGHPPAPAGAAYVPPALVAAYVEEAGGARLWPKAFAALHGPAPEAPGLLPVARSVHLPALAEGRESVSKTPKNEIEAKALARYTTADAAAWEKATSAHGDDWPKVVKSFRSTKYGRKKKETPWTSTSEATASSTAPSPTSSSLPENTSTSSPATEEPKSRTPTPSPRPSLSPLADGAVAQLRRPGADRSVDVGRDDVARALASGVFHQLAPGSRWSVGGQDILVGKADEKHSEVTIGGAKVKVATESLRLRLARSFGVSFDQSIESVIAPVAPKPERTSPLKHRAQSLYLKCMRASRAGQVDDKEIIAATDLVMRRRYEEAISAMETILMKVKVSRSAGTPPGAPNTSGEGHSAASNEGKGGGSRRKAIGEESTWTDGSRHVKVGPGKWKEVSGGKKHKPESAGVGKGKGVGLQGAQARLQKLREQRRRTSSPEVKKQIDQQIKSVKDRIKRLRGPSNTYHGSARQVAGARTARSHSDLVDRELLRIAAQAQKQDVPLSDTFQQLEQVMYRVKRSVVGTFENYAATQPGEAEGLAYLASASCPPSLHTSAQAYAIQHGYAALARALREGIT